MFFVDVIQRLRAGDEAAFRIIYDLHSGQVVSWSEEIVQKVFLKLWLNREGLNEQSNIWLYLYVITKRQCLNKLRDIRKSPMLFGQLMNGIEAADHTTEE